MEAKNWPKRTVTTLIDRGATCLDAERILRYKQSHADECAPDGRGKLGIGELGDGRVRLMVRERET